MGVDDIIIKIFCLEYQSLGLHQKNLNFQLIDKPKLKRSK